MLKAGNQTLVKINNQNAIINFIIKNGPISRAELAKRLKISKPTVSTNVEGLLEKHILLEVGRGETHIGKKPILLDFNKNYKYVLACDLSRINSKIVVSNLLGEIVAEDKIVIYNNLLSRDMKEYVKDSVIGFLKENNIDKDKISRVVIASPGIINEDSDQKLLNPQFKQLEEINIKGVFKEILNTEVIIKNDINLAALGEKHFGAGKEYANLAYISIGLGIGAGIIINGSLYEGSRKAAGEMGYVIPLIGQNVKGEYVSLENIAIIGAIENRLRQEMLDHKDSLLYELVDKKVDDITFDKFKKAVLAGDDYCSSIAGGLGEQLGIAVGNLSAVLDLELIVIGGEVSRLGQVFINPIEEIINKIVPFSSRVEVSRLENAGILGGIKVAIEDTLKNII